MGEKIVETLPRPFVRWYLNGKWIGDAEYNEEDDSSVTPRVKEGIQPGDELSWEIIE